MIIIAKAKVISFIKKKGINWGMLIKNYSIKYYTSISVYYKTKI